MLRPGDSFTIRPARSEDVDRIAALLDSESLPVTGIAEHVGTFMVAVAGGRVVGAIGLEPYGDTALLRSAVVDRENQNSGIGSALYDEILNAAHARGVKTLVLLTTTAEHYFGRKGFEVVNRGTIVGPVTGSAEFQGACPESAVCMKLALA